MNYSPERIEAARVGCKKAYENPAVRERLSAALKAKWASGTRKPTPRTAHEKAGISFRRAYAEGRVKKVSAERKREAARLGGLKFTEKGLEANRRTAQARIGALNPTGPSEKGPNNIHGKWWAFKAPNNTIMAGKNLNELIRCNAHMFDPADVVWRKSRCRTSSGLAGLTLGRVNNAVSWKGWVVVPMRAEEIASRVADAQRQLAS